MEFLNLTIAQLGALFASAAAISVALYLLDRSRRRQVVATLRFWTAAGQPSAVSRKKHIQQPWSLLLQLLGMALLLLALAEFQFGGVESRRRNHVLVLDTSAWMNARRTNSETLMDAARAGALGWLRAVPSADRVLLIRADGLATPATAWETDHRRIARAILDSEPGPTALNLAQSLAFAREMQRQANGAPGEIVYAGPGRLAAREAASAGLPALPALRVLNVDDPIENAGIRSVGVHGSDVLVRVRNYGRAPRAVNVTLNFAKAPQGMRQLQLAPGTEQEASFTLHTATAGLLETRLYPGDGFAADNYAALELPSQRTLHVVVYSGEPDAIRPALASDPRVNAEFRAPSQYVPTNDGLLVLDGFRPAAAPQGNVLWIDPPREKGPVPVRERIDKPEGLRWIPGGPLTAGLRAHGSELPTASVFEPAAGDIRVAEIAQGAVIVARPHMVAMGFNPFAGAMRYELTTPLLLANILRFMAPDTFRDVDVATRSAGAVSSPVDAQTSRDAVQVITDSGAALPFNIRERAVQFFVGDTARVRVLSGNSERIYSLTLPEMWDTKWSVPSGARRGIPAWNDNLRRSRVLWPFLALAGAALLVADWVLFGGYTTAPPRLVKAGAVEI